MRRHYQSHLGAPQGQANKILAHANNICHLTPTNPVGTNDCSNLYILMFSPPLSYSLLSDKGLDVVDEDQIRSYLLHCRSSQHNMESLRLGSGSHMLSPSVSQASSIASRTTPSMNIHCLFSPQSPQPKYNASKPYSASLSDARVCTTLRPAFM